MTDDKTRQLENRIDKLESTIEKMMPSRRDALKMGGAALVGGAAMTGSASAGTNQVGTIGSASQPVDVESEDINNADTIQTQNILPRDIGNGYHFAAAFDGADPDARLANALAAASSGDSIFLENATYNADLTVSQKVGLVGTSTSGSVIDAAWTINNDRVIFDTLDFIGNIQRDEITVNAGSPLTKLRNISVGGGGDIRIASDRVMVSDTSIGSVGGILLEGGTSGCIVDTIQLGGGANVTDNGSNTVGDTT